MIESLDEHPWQWVDIDAEAEPEAMYPLLAELAPEDWEDASAYGVPPVNRV